MKNYEVKLTRKTVFEHETIITVFCEEEDLQSHVNSLIENEMINDWTPVEDVDVLYRLQCREIEEDLREVEQLLRKIRGDLK